MVELRKRPQREPPAPAPAAKKGKAASSSKVSKPAPKKESGVAGKAKAMAEKVKEAVSGPLVTDSKDKQPAVEDETVVEKGETGMIPETAGTAPSTTTAPGPETANAGPDPELGIAAANAKASGPPIQSTKQARGTKNKAQALGMAGATTTQAPVEAAPAAPAEPSPATTATPTPPPSDPIGGEERPPATDDLENPPEKGAVEPASTSSTSGPPVELSTSVQTATLPLSTEAVGKQIPDLNSFGGHVETHGGQKASVSDLLHQATSGGIVIFTYPRASTPGCTTQACSFRDHHDEFTGTTGYKIFGLSTDSTKANTTFATKQNLQYPLLCDPGANLTGALGMKKAGNTKGTLRGVVVIDHQGIVKVWFQGGPGATVEKVKEYFATLK